MIFKFTTINGTVYELDDVANTWKRVVRTKRSGHTRRDSGTLRSWPIIRIGHPAYIEDMDVLPGCVSHFLYTSEVVSTETVE